MSDTPQTDVEEVRRLKIILDLIKKEAQ